MSRDEPLDLGVDATDYPHQLASKRLRRDVDGDVGRARFLDVEDQQQRCGGTRGRAKRDLAEHHELRLVDSQVDDQVDLQRDLDVEGDHLADVTGQAGLLNPDFGRHLGDFAGALRHRAHLEFVTGDRGDRTADTVFGHGDLEELATELFVGHFIVDGHGAHTVSRRAVAQCPTRPNRDNTAVSGPLGCGLRLPTRRRRSHRRRLSGPRRCRRRHPPCRLGCGHVVVVLDVGFGFVVFARAHALRFTRR